MPCSGGDVGLNVWVENDELLFYIGRAGYRDENGALLKPGRVRMKLVPNPFENGKFRQELKLREGHVSVDDAQRDRDDNVTVTFEIPLSHGTSYFTGTMGLRARR